MITFLGVLCSDNESMDVVPIDVTQRCGAVEASDVTNMTLNSPYKHNQVILNKMSLPTFPQGAFLDSFSN